MSEPEIQIRGGVGPYEAAAIAAAIRRTLDEEEARRTRRPARDVPPAWVRSGMPAPFGRFVPPVVPDPGRYWPV